MTIPVKSRVGVSDSGLRVSRFVQHSFSVLRVFTCSLHCSSFLGLPYRILVIYLVKPKKGTTMETIGSTA